MASYGPKPKPRNLSPQDAAPWDCMRCARSLRISDYHPHPSGSYGYTKKCKECTNAEAREAAVRRGPEYARDQKLRVNFGITLVEFQDMLKAQGEACAICKREQPVAVARGWHVDHDHACCPIAGKSCGGCVRGILCHSCNLALGHFRDSPETMRAAILYLEAQRG